MPQPLRGWTIVAVIAIGVTLVMALAASAMGRPPDGLSVYGRQVDSVAAVWLIPLYTTVMSALLLWRRRSAWYVLTAWLLIDLAIGLSMGWFGFQLLAMLCVLGLPSSRQYYGVSRRIQSPASEAPREHAASE